MTTGVEHWRASADAGPDRFAEAVAEFVGRHGQRRPDAGGLTGGLTGGPPACLVPYAPLEAVKRFLLPLGGGGTASVRTTAVSKQM